MPQAYLLLAGLSYNFGENTFVCVRNLHAIHEIQLMMAHHAKISNMAFWILNPVCETCSVDEDLIGRVALLTASVTQNNCQKVAGKVVSTDQYSVASRVKKWLKFLLKRLVCHVFRIVVIFASLGLVNCMCFFQQCRLPRTQKPENLQNRSSMLITFWYVQYRSCMARSSLRDQEYCLVFQGVAGNTTRSGYLPKFHHMLRLSLDVTLQLHQILRLPGKVTFQHHCNFTKYLAVKSDTSLFFSSVFDSILYSSLLYSILYSIRLYSTIAFLIFKTP